MQIPDFTAKNHTIPKPSFGGAAIVKMSFFVSIQTERAYNQIYWNFS